jgi:hypothetical protein
MARGITLKCILERSGLKVDSPVVCMSTGSGTALVNAVMSHLQAQKDTDVFIWLSKHQVSRETLHFPVNCNLGSAYGRMLGNTHCTPAHQRTRVLDSA